VNYLSELVEALIDFGFCPSQAFLTDVDRIGKQGTAFLYGLGITAILEFDTSAFEEAVQVLVKLIFFKRFHSIVPFD